MENFCCCLVSVVFLPVVCQFQFLGLGFLCIWFNLSIVRSVRYINIYSIWKSAATGTSLISYITGTCHQSSENIALFRISFDFYIRYTSPNSPNFLFIHFPPVRCWTILFFLLLFYFVFFSFYWIFNDRCLLWISHTLV